MHTFFDWASMAVFVGLIVLFLQRSTAAGEPKDRMWEYAFPAVGCALANYVGNKGVEDGNLPLEILSVVILLAVVGYIFHILKPFAR